MTSLMGDMVGADRGQFTVYRSLGSVGRLPCRNYHWSGMLRARNQPRDEGWATYKEL